LIRQAVSNTTNTPDGNDSKYMEAIFGGNAMYWRKARRDERDGCNSRKEEKGEKIVSSEQRKV
jgi:hypothetical protein